MNNIRSKRDWDLVEQAEPKKHRDSRLKIEGYLKKQGFEILSNNSIQCDFNYFCMPYFSLRGRFSTRLSYIHHYDIVAMKEVYLNHTVKLILLNVYEIDGWDSRHGENASRRTRYKQNQKDVIAEGIYKVMSDIVRIFNPKARLDPSFQRVRSERILKCKDDKDILEYLNEELYTAKPHFTLKPPHY